MTENRFFIWVWRFNAIMIAIAALLVVSLILWELTRYWRVAYFLTQTTDVIVATPDDGEVPRDVQEEKRLGAPLNSGEGGLYALGLYVDQTYQNRGISKSSGGNLINYVIVDLAAGANRLLFAKNNQVIIETTYLNAPYGQGQRHPTGQIIWVVGNDTNGDERLSRNDLGAAYYVDPSWGEPVLLADNVTRLIHGATPELTQLDLIFDTPDGAVAARYRIPAGDEIARQNLEH